MLSVMRAQTKEYAVVRKWCDVCV